MPLNTRELTQQMHDSEIHTLSSPHRPTTTTLPPEMFPLIAKAAHPETARSLKRLNSRCNGLISTNDLVLGEMYWRLSVHPIGDCLIWGARNGHKIVVTTLLASGRNPPKETPDVWGPVSVALSRAAARGFTEIVSLLLASEDIYGLKMRAVLDETVKNGHAAVLSLLLDAGAEANGSRWAINTPLVVAASKNYVEVVSILLAAGADPYRNDHYVSIYATDFNILSNLMEFYIGTPHQHEALHILSGKKNPDIVANLLAAGADVHVDGEGPLMTAVEVGDAAMVSLLLAAGADLHSGEDMALCRAVGEGHCEVIATLLDAGADMCGGNPAAWRIAVDGECPEVIKLMADWGRRKGLKGIEKLWSLA